VARAELDTPVAATVAQELATALEVAVVLALQNSAQHTLLRAVEAVEAIKESAQRAQAEVPEAHTVHMEQEAEGVLPQRVRTALAVVPAARAPARKPGRTVQGPHRAAPGDLLPA
jgi:hypothetical protein